MVQDTLVEYINSQKKLGITREAIKAALVGAGWQAADVEDTLKKVESDAKPEVKPEVKPATPAAGHTVSLVSGNTSPSSKPSEPQSIRVSDLISSSDSPAGAGSSFPSKSMPSMGPSVGADRKPATPSSSFPSSKPGPSIMPSGSSATLAKIASSAKGSSRAQAGPKTFDLAGISKSGNEFSATGKRSKGLIIAIVVAVIFAGAAGYLYFENTSLGSQVAALNGQSTNVTSQVASLNTQVKALDASNTALMAEEASLTAANQDLLTNLSFAVSLPDVSSTATVSVSGDVVYIRPLYVLTTPYGIKVYVKNSSDAKVAAALKPLLATANTTSTASSTVTLTGTHDNGSSYITVTEVNGSAVQ